MCAGGVLLLRDAAGKHSSAASGGRRVSVPRRLKAEGTWVGYGEVDFCFRLFVDRGSGVPASWDEREGGKLG